MGDSPDLPLENAWSANLGATYMLDARDSRCLARRPPARREGGSRTRELMGFWTPGLKARRSQVYGLIGLADGSPDWGFGLSLARPL